MSPTADFAPGRHVPVRQILAPLRHGGGDPTWCERDGEVWRACHTPQGAATIRLRIRPEPSGDRVLATGYGAGASWVLDRLPALLGGLDDPSGLVPQHDAVRHAVVAAGFWRICRTHLVVDSLVPAVLGQKVTGREAFSSYRTLVLKFGSPAPGPGAGIGLVVPPSAQEWAQVPSWEWTKAGVDAHRADTVMRALAVAPRLEEAVDLPADLARKRLRAVAGIGVWTAAEVTQRAFGDADAVSFGDYHVAKNLGLALVGEPVDDRRLAEILRPYAGHRYRVQHLLMAYGPRPQRRGARRSLPGHLPTRW